MKSREFEVVIAVSDYTFYVNAKSEEEAVGKALKMLDTSDASERIYIADVQETN